MKTDIFTKTTFGVIALALLVLAAQGWQNRTTTVQAASAGWEYKFISETYGFDNNRISTVLQWTEDGAALPLVNGKADLGKKFQELGAQGWELVTDIPHSFRMNMKVQDGWAANGVTSDEMIIFKRPKH